MNTQGKREKRGYAHRAYFCEFYKISNLSSIDKMTRDLSYIKISKERFDEINVGISPSPEFVVIFSPKR